MKVAVDISPTKTGHSVRGIGSYTRSLIEEFKKRTWQGVKFEFFQNSASPPPSDLVHYPYFDLFFHTLPIKKTAQRIVTIHDVIPLIFPNYFPAGIKGYINLFFQKMALKNTSAVICDSQTSKNDIVERLSYPKDKIHVVYLAPGVNFKPISDQRYLAQISKKFKLPSKFVLYVGDVNWNKNISNLLEAVKLAKVNLVMVGEALVNRRLPQTEEIDSKIKHLTLDQKVLRTGYVTAKELVFIYNLAQATLLPSYYEGFGLPLLESMACGTPVVCSKVASLSEIAGTAAIFCDPTDPKDIAKKIKSVLNLTKKDSKSISQKSIKHASRFNWQKVTKQTIDVYRSVLK